MTNFQVALSFLADGLTKLEVKELAFTDVSIDTVSAYAVLSRMDIMDLGASVATRARSHAAPERDDEDATDKYADALDLLISGKVPGGRGGLAMTCMTQTDSDS
eukprot:3251794-Alexandrium_andersonii.AAC.1